MTSGEISDIRFPERPPGYSRASMRFYPALVADLREKGFAPGRYASEEAAARRTDGRRPARRTTASELARAYLADN
jgi:predicted alpha/beta-hydrolase family hydrolase